MKRIFSLVIIVIALFCSCYTPLQAQYWQRVSLPAAYDNTYWLDVFFLPGNKQLGWVCGFNASVVRTTDGGATWSGTKVTQFQNPMLESIHFVNPQIGYASGPQGIWKSVDGGASWTDITPMGAGGLWGCYFKDANLGLVIGSGCGGPQLFYRTTDGGISWNLFSGSLANSGMCDLILDPNSDIGYASSSGYIWKTTDAGISWNTFSQSNIVNAWQEELAWLGNSFLVPVSGTSCNGGGSGGMCFSTDLGNSWNRSTVANSLFGSSLTSATTGWACGYNKSVYYTSDAGRSWDLKNCGTTGSLDDIRMFSDTEGWVVGEGIYKLVNAKHEVIPASELSFSSLCVNSVKTDTIRLRNGSFQSTIASLSIVGPADKDFILPANNIALGPCEEKLIPLQYRPTAAGARQADLITTFSNPLETFTLRLRGTASDVTLSTGLKDTISTDSAMVGTTRDSSFMVYNRSAVQIVLNSISPLENAPGHTMLWNTSLPLTIKANDSALIRYRIIINDTGTTNQRFRFSFSQCDKTIPVKSYGTSPRISTPENFLIITSCNQVTDTSFIIRNIGNAPLIVDSIRIAGIDGAMFSLGQTNFPMVIAPGGSKTIRLQCKKLLIDSILTIRADLLIYHSDTLSTRLSPRRVALYAKRGYSILTSKTYQVDAGIHCINAKGKATFTTEVTGTDPVTIHSMKSIHGIAKVISPNTFPRIINSPLQCTIETSVSQPGVYTDTLYIIQNICKDTLIVAIRGEAVFTQLSFADTILTGTIDQGNPTVLSWPVFSTGTAFALCSKMTLSVNQQIQLVTPLPQPFNLLPNDKGIISVRISAGYADSVLLDTLCVEAKTNCPYTICIPIRITVRQARLTFSDTLSIMNLLCDSIATDTLWISNNGQLNDTILRMDFRENQPGSILSMQSGITLPHSMTPGDSIPLIVRFAPNTQGRYTATITIESASGNRAGDVQVLSVEGVWHAPSTISLINAHMFGIDEPCSLDTTISIGLRNTGLLDDTLQVLPFAHNYLFTDKPEYRITSRTDDSIKLTYSPSLAQHGLWNDTLVVRSKTCNTIIKIPLSGMIDTISLTVNPAVIDAGSIYQDDQVQSTAIVKNTSLIPITINNQQLSIGKSEFTITCSRPIPFTLQPSDTVHVEIISKGLIQGSLVQDTLLISANADCKDTLFLPLRMNVPVEQYSAIIRTEHYSAFYGDTVAIQCSLIGDLTLARIDTLSFTLNTDGRLIEIFETLPPAMITKSDSSIVWNIPVSKIPLSGGILSTIRARALVTNPRQSPLFIDSINAITNRSVTITPIHGSISVSPYCVNNLALIMQGNQFAFKILPPHPVQSHISIAYHATGDEAVNGTITVFSLQGSTIYSETVQAQHAEHTWKMPFGLTPGTYIVEVGTPSRITRQLIMVSP